jgi:hypothetical protein
MLQESGQRLACSLAPIPLRQIGFADLADLRRVLPPPGEEK